MKKIIIFQVNGEAPNAHYIKFSGLELVQKMGLELSMSIYNKVYEGEVEDKGNTIDTLNAVYSMLNIGRKPEGFTGHSLSVSDVIEMDGKYYYVDSYGFSEVQL